MLHCFPTLPAEIIYMICDLLDRLKAERLSPGRRGDLGWRKNRSRLMCTFTVDGFVEISDGDTYRDGRGTAVSTISRRSYFEASLTASSYGRHVAEAQRACRKPDGSIEIDGPGRVY